MSEPIATSHLTTDVSTRNHHWGGHANERHSVVMRVTDIEVAVPADEFVLSQTLTTIDGQTVKYLYD